MMEPGGAQEYPLAPAEPPPPRLRFEPSPELTPPPLLDSAIPPPPPRWNFPLILTWVIIAALLTLAAVNIAVVGLDLRSDFWTAFHDNHYWGDIDSAIINGDRSLHNAFEITRQNAGQPSKPFLRRDALTWLNAWTVLRGWVATYPHLQQTTPSGEFDVDYPPLRLLAMTLFTWRTQCLYPGVRILPRYPGHVIDPVTKQRIAVSDELIKPLLVLNTLCTGLSAILMGALVAVWVRRDPNIGWGDRALLAPVVVLLLALIVAPLFRWTPADPPGNQFDALISSPGFWIFWSLRYLCLLSLARFLPRPFRAVACGFVAAVLVWLNPAVIIDSHGWPQWDTWLLPFFIGAVLLASLDCWFWAGAVIGVGCMFKGQLLLAAPVLLLCQAFAGSTERFLRIIAGTALGAAAVVWPWLIQTRWAAISVLLVVVVAVGSLVATKYFSGFRPKLSRNPVRFAIVFLASALLGILIFSSHWLGAAEALLAISAFLGPWMLPRRTWKTWFACLTAAAIWVAGFGLGGDFAWWDIGFAYGMRRFQGMQLSGESLSNLCSLLAERFGWHLHDPAATLHLPIVGRIPLDLRQMLGLCYGIAVVLCAIGAAMHLRRNSARFLIAMVAPLALFPAILPQMSARYTMFAAVMAAALIAISCRLALLQGVLTVLSCIMIGNALLLIAPGTAPLTKAITGPTHPDIAWALLLVAAMLLYSALAPQERRVAAP